MYKHKCIKPTCQADYEDNDPDAYYCLPCTEEKKLIAKEVEMRIGSTVGQKPKSQLQAFDELRKSTGMNFVNIRDLGITL